MLNSRRVGILLFIVIQLCLINTVKVYQNVSAATVLRKNIFKNYDKVVIPITRDYLKTSISLTITNVEMDYEKARMIVSTLFVARWIDDRLIWEPDEYEQVTSITVNHHEIWRPDIMAYNNIDTNMEDDQTHVNSVVHSSGSVVWVQPVQYKIHCQMDLTNWPYDKQNGVLKLGSWTYSGNEMNLTTEYDSVEIINSHSEWNITNVSQERHVITYVCCTDQQYIDIEYNITIKRKVHPYQSTIFVPALCSAIFNLITFWLPYTDNYCKLSVNLFNALFIELNILIVYSKVPIVTSSIPLIVIYYTYSLTLIAITTMMSMIVKALFTVNKPLPHKVTQFLHSSYLVYLGVEINNLTTESCMLCESEDKNVQTADLNERKKLGKVIDRMCFVIFTLVYLILILRFMPYTT